MEVASYAPAVRIDLATIVVDDYDRAVEFFVGAARLRAGGGLGGADERWATRSAGSWCGHPVRRQASSSPAPTGRDRPRAVGNQTAGRVGFFLRVDDFDAAHERMRAAGVEFVSPPRDEPYGRVAVFVDVAGNRWDLLGAC